MQARLLAARESPNEFYKRRTYAYVYVKYNYCGSATIESKLAILQHPLQFEGQLMYWSILPDFPSRTWWHHMSAWNNCLSSEVFLFVDTPLGNCVIPY